MVSETKKQLVQELSKEVQNNQIVGIVNMANLPAQQLQKMRAMLKKKGVSIRMTRKRLIAHALKSSGTKNVEQLIEKMKGLPALLVTNTNPFALYSIIQKNKSEAPAKAGQEAPKDIVVSAGPTNFAPGPIISELASVGIKTKVENGKLAIISDVTVAKEGDVISAQLAESLKRLDIKPMEIGLDLVAVLEDGYLFEAKQLFIDEEQYAADITQAAQFAFNLAVECAFVTEETKETLIQKAFREAKNLAVEIAYLNADTTDEILAKSERQAQSIKNTANL